jgi:hypothetical protein
MLRWQRWEVDDPLHAVSMASAVYGWAVGSGGSVFRWDGQSWSSVASPTDGDLVSSIDMVSADDGWAVGFGGHPRTAGFILYWDGAAWAEAPNPSHHGPMSVDMVSAIEGWAAGKVRILRSDGTSCTPFPWPRGLSGPDADEVLTGVSMIAADEGCVSGAVLREPPSSDSGLLLRLVARPVSATIHMPVASAGGF